MALSARVGSLFFGLLASCAVEDQGLDLAGREFISESLVGRELVPGTEIRLRFRERELSADAGCNSMFGNYQLEEGVLAVSSMGSTAIGCELDLHAQDEWLAGFLTSRPTFELVEPRLTLTSSAEILTLLDRELKSPDRPLIGTHWVGAGVGDGTSATFGSGWEVATVAFGTDGKFAAFSGCQHGTGTFTADETTIDFAELGYDAAACADANLGYLSERFLFVLDGSEVAFEIEERSLKLIRAGTSLYFTAAE